MTPLQLELVRTCADVCASAVITIGLPMIATWAVKKNLIQQRWATMIEAAAVAGYAAGIAAGPIGSPAFIAAAGAEVLSYAKRQSADVLAAKKMTDAATIDAGMARVNRIAAAAQASPDLLGAIGGLRAEVQAQTRMVAS